MQPLLAQPITRWHGWWFATISSRLPHANMRDEGQSFTQEPLVTVEDFEQFFLRCEGQITGYLRRIVGDDGAANDLCQETFMRAWQHFAEISGYARPETWLFRVASNLALNHLRRQGSPIAAAEPINDESVPYGGDMANQLAESEQVRQTLLELPPRARALLVLREVYGLTLDEAAHALHLSPAAAKKMLYRARVAFRRSYTQKEGR
jgi:RNA polymerase sigma factor (sigma-70 family)